MTETVMLDAYGTLTEPTTLTIQRHLPGPIERVWAYLTDEDLRRKWFAAGAMELKAGAPFEFVWRNDELTDPPGKRPEGSSPEHRMTCHIIEVDPPRRLAFTFGQAGEVAIDLEPVRDRVLLTLVHRRLPDRGTILKVSPGWHGHLDVLAARLAGEQPAPFWDNVARLRKEYEARLPG
ncbi:SRPBCC family protein [Falsiroseomonas sp. HW251]|uniref:SRPBCC family protein n=1 Tax=Falsiroseomonas sp. HW251 TaxID=3390998 RepID=UPI003D3162E1